jgi:type I restriction enzyme, R subunit
MPTTDTSERGLESLIFVALTGLSAGAAPDGRSVGEPRPAYGGAGYLTGDPKDYDRNHAVDLAELPAFL